MSDKYTATWVSHTSMSDFLACPRAYFLKNIYKSPESGKKMQIMSPPLALGQVVHDVLESLSVLPVEDRLRRSLVDRFEERWSMVAGKKGGFVTPSTEENYKERGREMLRRVMNNPGPIVRKAIKIKTDLPHYWLSETDEIILCGKIDWLEYLPDEDAVHIIDFKTGKSEEQADSLQLPIYLLLVSNTQQRVVSKASYWYLAASDDLTKKELPKENEAHEKVLSVAKQVRLARKLDRFKCPNGSSGCRNCIPFERVIRGEGEHVGLNSYGQDVFILAKKSDEMPESEIL